MLTSFDLPSVGWEAMCGSPGFLVSPPDWTTGSPKFSIDVNASVNPERHWKPLQEVSEKFQ